MSTEPEWPTDLDDNNDDDGEFLHASWRRGFNEGVAKSRAAWLLANDDPSESPIGEVRRSPAGGQVVKYHDESVGRRWIRIGIRDTTIDDAYVKGWPVIGAVPGTPAAEATS